MKPICTGGGFAVDNQLSTRKSLCFPRLCVFEKRWLCAFRCAYAKEQSRGQETRITWSDDEGKTWSEPIAPFQPLTFQGKRGVFREAGLSVGKPGELLASLWWIDFEKPDLPLFNWHTEGLLDSKLFLSKSYDHGETWSTPQHVPTGPFTKSTPIASHMIMTKKALAYPFEQYKKYYERGDWRHYSAMMLSYDHGSTWNHHFITAHDPNGQMFYWDQRPCSIGGSEIFLVFDAFEKGTNTRPNIHARISSDNLQNWSEIWDTGVQGQPGYPLELPDGHISLVYNDRGENPGIKMRLSYDGGRTFPESTTFVVYSPFTAPDPLNQRINLQDVMLEINEKSVFGYPSQQLLPNEDILITYYAGDHADSTSIKWTRIRL